MMDMFYTSIKINLKSIDLDNLNIYVYIYLLYTYTQQTTHILSV